MKITQPKRSIQKQVVTPHHFIYLRRISFVLAVTLLFPILTACRSTNISDSATQTETLFDTITEQICTTEVTDVEIEESDAEIEEPELKIVYPEISVSTLEYTLSDADVTSFVKKLNTCKALFFSNSKKNEDKLEKELYALCTIDAYIKTQNNIALLLYEYDLSDKTAQKNREESSKIYADISDQPWDFFAEAKAKNNTLTPIVTKFMHDNFSTVDVYDEAESDRAHAQMTQIKTRS